MNASLRSEYLIPRQKFAGKQKLNFVLTVVTPLVLTLALPMTFPDFDWISWQSIITFLVTWYLTGCLGISVGFHRFFSHRSFNARRGVKLGFAVFGLAAAQGPLLYWVALHRHHHVVSDKETDIHSPHSRICADPHLSVVNRWFRSHLLWVWSHDVPTANRFAMDIRADRDLRRTDEFYWPIVLAGILLPGLVLLALNGTFESFVLGTYWGGFARIAIGQNIIWSINSFCHLIGRRPHENGDHSSNVAVLAIPSFGESWHNNHHHDPANPRFGTRATEFDIGFNTIQVLFKLGLANPRRPRAA